MNILEIIKNLPYLRSVLRNDNADVSYKTLLIGVGTPASTIVEQMKDQDTGIINYCSADQQSLYEISNMQKRLTALQQNIL